MWKWEGGIGLFQLNPKLLCNRFTVDYWYQEMGGGMSESL